MTDACAWNRAVASLPGTSFLQTWEWAQVKAQFGWLPHYRTWQGPEGETAAVSLVLERAVPERGNFPKMRILYAPRGPLLPWEDETLRGEVLAGIKSFSQEREAIFVKIDPEVVLGTAVPGTGEARDNPAGIAVQEALRLRGWRYATDQVQFRNTVTIDLTHDLDNLLSKMKQKTRYNIRLAERKGVRVRPGFRDDFELLYRMYAETALRDGFAIRTASYYHALWGAFLGDRLPPGSDFTDPAVPVIEPLVAEVDGEPVAAVMVIRFARRGWYFNGMSLQAHREKMPNYLLQWEAFQRLKAAGCLSYDLWGAPEDFQPGDPLWNVYRFKEGLGGSVVRTLGAWDFPTRPRFYDLYHHVLPRLLSVLRRRGETRIRQAYG